MAAAGGAGAPTYSRVGIGSYGVVIKPALPNINEHGALINYPSNVTKLFYNKDNKNKAFANSERIIDILGNESHRMYPYRKVYNFSRLTDPNVNRQIPKNLIKKRVNRRLPLKMLRMRDLGVEIGKLSDRIHYTPLRNVPFLTILQEIRKVFGQIHRLVENNYIHGDVRQTNVLIQPRTGVISLIDFDWLYPRAQFFIEYNAIPAFGFYSNPPESLLLRNTLPNPITSLTDPGIRPEDIIAAIPADEIVPADPDAMKLLDKYTYFTVNSWEGVKGDNAVAVKTEIQNALIHNINYIRTKLPAGQPKAQVIEGFIAETFDRFDNYGLAATLFIVLKFVYVMTPPHTALSQADHINVLRARIKNNGSDYTDDELERIVVALRALEDLLNRASSFRIDERLTSGGVLAELDTIIARFQAAAPPPAPNAAAPNAAPNVAAEIAAGIAAARGAGPNFGGARRSRRHQLRGRRQKTRRSRRSRRTARK